MPQRVNAPVPILEPVLRRNPPGDLLQNDRRILASNPEAFNQRRILRIMLRIKGSACLQSTAFHDRGQNNGKMLFAGDRNRNQRLPGARRSNEKRTPLSVITMYSSAG